MKFSSALLALSVLVAPTNAQTIVDVAVSTGIHTTLVDLVTQAGLVDLLSGEGPFTLFGPTDDAFGALPESAGKFTTPEWHAHLEDILKYHVTVQEVRSTDLVLNDPIGMANGGDTSITSMGPPPVINTATIGPFDVNATNGVVHVIDQVLLPTSATDDIVAVATSPSASVFSTLVEAVTAADLVATLQGPGPFTVFAPTNDAFAAVDSGILDYLLSTEGKDDLINVLTYHVFPGVVYQSDIVDGPITMVNTDDATITVSPPMIEDANIVQGQILASNGVIHPIDKVIIPPSFTPPATSAPDEPSSAVSVGSMFALASAAVAAMLF